MDSTVDKSLIGQRIRDARIAKGMSQADLADKADSSIPHISNIELGKTMPLLDSFIKIIEALQVSADSILRPDTPHSEPYSNQELSLLLSDCTPKERDAILTVAKQMKATFRAQKDDN